MSGYPMIDESYWKFHELCSVVESRFGGFRKLRLVNDIDFNVFTDGSTLDFGSGDSRRHFGCVDLVKLEPDERHHAHLRHSSELMNYGSRFENVFVNQVFEHIDKQCLQGIIDHISFSMKKGAIMIATLPNVCNWIKYICDYDHKSPLAFYHLGALLECSDMSVIDCYRYTKRPDEIIKANSGEQLILDTLRKFFEIDPAGFVAIVAEKR